MLDDKIFINITKAAVSKQSLTREVMINVVIHSFYDVKNITKNKKTTNKRFFIKENRKKQLTGNDKNSLIRPVLTRQRKQLSYR